ncbi:MAG: methylenetetrahydrofolate--tRNA-(uracil(54)-C(5))-methyltransferase (FADH(2)-oxidizing) TrmFO [Rickettsiales bacterium]
MQKELNIIGGGLAGCEAAWQAAQLGIKVNIYEMRDENITTPAHQTSNLAELVCSNSFRSDDINSAIGLLHQEMRLLNSLILTAADQSKVPAGSALAMDREQFSILVEQNLSNHPNITIHRKLISELPKDGKWIIATGPLTDNSLMQDIIKVGGAENLAFFDAIAPIAYKDSIDFSKAWFQSRYDKGSGKDYINCPLTKEQYYQFVDNLINGDKTEFKEWEKNTPYFDGCLPIEVMAERGKETLRFGPMKPVGLTNPHSSENPYAVVQLRQDNKLATLYNIVGFQTKLKYHAQQQIFKTIPGLENVEFARLGGIHRNSFINSPILLQPDLTFKPQTNIRFAGQVTGVEGYVESAACGLLAGLFAAHELLERKMPLPPLETALGALLNHITGGAEAACFQPMNINFGLFPPLEGKHKKTDRKEAYAKRALEKLPKWQLDIKA